MSDQSTLAPTSEQVEYRSVVGYPGYRVGNDGSVWTCWKKVGLGGRHGTAAVMSGEYRRMNPVVQKSGHMRVRLAPSRDRRLVHHLVLAAFVGPCPDGMECRHFPDRDPTNNRLSNLQWGTKKQNQADRIEQGTDGRGERCATAKLSDAIVVSVRAEYATGRVTMKSLALRHCVTITAVRLAIRMKTWRHVPNPTEEHA